MTIEFDIDRFVPDYEVPAFVSKRRRRYPRNFSWVLIKSLGGRTTSVGVRPETMIDWRSIESRYHSILTKSMELHLQFWDLLGKLGPELCQDSTTDKVFVLDDEDVLVYHSGRKSYTLDSASRIIDKQLTTSSEKYVLVTREQGGDALNKVLKRCTSQDKALQKYKAAFRTAVNDRLDVFMREEVRSQNTFIIRNEDRQYVVSIDGRHGGYVWFDNHCIYQTRVNGRVT